MQDIKDYLQQDSKFALLQNKLIPLKANNRKITKISHLGNEGNGMKTKHILKENKN